MEKRKDTTPVLQYHAVLLYDLVGQSTKLRRITSIPETEEDRREVETLLSETAGAVIRMRKHMIQFYENITKSQIDGGSLPPEARELFERSRAVQLIVRSFSDLTVAHTPLMEEANGRLPIASVVGLLSAAASMTLVSFAARAPIRGSLDVGLAIDLEGEEIYGPILDSVYRDESKVADWPRILAGNGIVEYLQTSMNDPGSEKESEVRRGLGRLGMDFISVDCDGKHIVDYMGAGAKKRMGTRVPYRLVQKAVECVEHELEMHRKEKDEKLVTRYERVQEYMVAREDLWRTE